jgi:hypothetical protein
MDVFVSTYNSASTQLDSIIWMVRDMIGGVVLCLILVIVARIILRAILNNIVGKSTASLWTTVLEVLLALCISLKTAENPAVAAVALGWIAAIFRKVVMGSI